MFVYVACLFSLNDLIAVSNVPRHDITCKCCPEAEQHRPRSPTGTMLWSWWSACEMINCSFTSLFFCVSSRRIFWNAIQYSGSRQRRPYSTRTSLTSVHPKFELHIASCRSMDVILSHNLILHHSSSF